MHIVRLNLSLYYTVIRLDLNGNEDSERLWCRVEKRVQVAAMLWVRMKKGTLKAKMNKS